MSSSSPFKKISILFCDPILQMALELLFELNPFKLHVACKLSKFALKVVVEGNETESAPHVGMLCPVMKLNSKVTLFCPPILESAVAVTL